MKLKVPTSPGAARSGAGRTCSQGGGNGAEAAKTDSRRSTRSAHCNGRRSFWWLKNLPFALISLTKGEKSTENK
eukprot:6050367-Amphidinium_carterae.1